MDCSNHSDRQTSRSLYDRKRYSKTSSHRRLNSYERSHSRYDHKRSRNAMLNYNRSSSSSREKSNCRDYRVHSTYRRPRTRSRSDSSSPVRRKRRSGLSPDRRHRRRRSGCNSSSSFSDDRPSFHRRRRYSRSHRMRDSSSRGSDGATFISDGNGRSCPSDHLNGPSSAARRSGPRRRHSSRSSVGRSTHRRSYSSDRRRATYEVDEEGSPCYGSNGEQTSRYSPSSHHKQKWRGNTNTIMIRELPVDLKEPEIREDLMTLGFIITDLRLVRRKDTGESRGFGFIDLISPEETKKFLDHTKGRYLLLNQFPVTFIPSPPRWDLREEQQRSYRPLCDLYRDWECVRCGIRNFKRREFCFKCSLSKEDSDKSRELDGSEAISTVPCSTLALRGLHPNGIESDRLLDIIEDNIINLDITPKNSFVVKAQDLDHQDSAYGERNSFAFVEFESIHDATVALERLKASKPSCLYIDNYQIFVDFARAAFSICVEEYTGPNKGESFRQTAAALNCSQDMNCSQELVASSETGTELANEVSASQPSHQRSFYDMMGLVTPEASAGYSAQACHANVGAAVAQAALQNLHAIKHRGGGTAGDGQQLRLKSKQRHLSGGRKRDKSHQLDVSASAIDSAQGVRESTSGTSPNTSEAVSGRHTSPSGKSERSASEYYAGLSPYGTAIGGVVANCPTGQMYWDGSQWYLVSSAPLSDKTLPVAFAEDAVATGNASSLDDPAHPCVAATVFPSDDLAKEPASHSCQQGDASGARDEAQPAVRVKHPKQSPKSIAKEMEKWASSQNKQKASSRKSASSGATASSLIRHPSLPAAASAMSAQRQQMQMMQEGAVPAGGASEPLRVLGDQCLINASLVSYATQQQNTDSFPDEQFITRRNWRFPAEQPHQDPVVEPQQAADVKTTSAPDNPPSCQMDPSALVDWTKLACMLCKRKFQSASILQKHIDLSALHKENVQKLQESTSETTLDSSSLQESRYRDRAKERRQMYSSATKCD